MSTNGHGEGDRPDQPAVGSGDRSAWMVVTLVGVAVVAVFVVAQVMGDDSAPGTETTGPSMPGTSTSSPATTEDAPGTSTVPTTEATDTTQAPTATEAGAPGTVPERALAVAGADLVWLDTTTGATDFVHEFLFEAQYPTRLAISADGARAYYQLYYEDSWFSCETASGQVMALDIASGSSTEIGRGLPALSPDGSRLAYLTSDDCFPDPDEPQFFVAVYDTMVITDADGAELARFGLEGEVGSPGSAALVNLIWVDDDTVLVLDETGTTYEVPADVDSPQPIHTYPRRDLTDHHLVAVVHGQGIGATIDAAGGGPLTRIDLGTGEATPIPEVPHSSGYAVGVAAEGALIVGADGLVLLGLDPFTGDRDGVFELASVAAIDW